MTACVLDTSVVVKWFSADGEDDLASALRLRDEILAGKLAVTVPDLLLYELANALRYNPNLTAADVKAAVASVVDMGFAVRGLDSPDSHLGRAVEIAFEGNVTVYDACFLALAELEGASLVTADYRFYERVKTDGKVLRLDRLWQAVPS